MTLGISTYYTDVTRLSVQCTLLIQDQRPLGIANYAKIWIDHNADERRPLNYGPIITNILQDLTRGGESGNYLPFYIVDM